MSRYGSRSYSSSYGVNPAWYVLAVVAGLFLIGGCFNIHNQERTVVTTVTAKDRVHTDAGSDARIYTDAGTFQVRDAMVVFYRQNSADFYASIKPCHKYQFRVTGFRFGLTSDFPNIKDAKDLGVDEDCVPE